jgi:ATP-dependent DNA helicase PIF1
MVGEGKISEPNDGTAEIEIPPELLITNYHDPIQGIVDSTYPDFLENYTNHQYLLSRAILASTIEVVDTINNYVLGLMPGNMLEFNLNFIVRIHQNIIIRFSILQVKNMNI